MFRSEPDADFQIQTDLSFHGTSFDAIRGGTAGATRPNAADASQSQQSDSDLKAPATTADRSRLRSNFGPRDAFNPNGRPPKPTNRRPIIIIPASGTALISMYNAEDILQVSERVCNDAAVMRIKRRHLEFVLCADRRAQKDEKARIRARNSSRQRQLANGRLSSDRRSSQATRRGLGSNSGRLCAGARLAI